MVGSARRVPSRVFEACRRPRRRHRSRRWVENGIRMEECVELVYCSACCESLRSARSLRVGDTGRGDEREETGVEQRRGWSYVAGGVVRGTQEAGLKK